MMNLVFADFEQAHLQRNGYLLAKCITPSAPLDKPGLLYSFVRESNAHQIEGEVRYATVYNNKLHAVSKSEKNAWLDVLVAFWKTCAELLNAEELENKVKNSNSSSSRKKDDSVLSQWAKVYENWKEVVNALFRGYNSAIFSAWTIPCLYIAGKYLRVFAIKADEAARKQQGSGLAFNAAPASLNDDVVGSGTAAKHERLEDAARQINRLFGLCLGDRAPLEDSRKWAVYYIANLLFKTYFRLNSLSLCKNILRSLQASTTDMPPLSAFPKSHRVTFKYYSGVVQFLEEDYARAEELLAEALALLPAPGSAITRHTSHRSQILTFLIPCRLLTSHKLPSTALLAQSSPQIQALFVPLKTAIRKGDLAGFDAALEAERAWAVRRRIYLTLERGRDVVLRNLFRKVYLAAPPETAKDASGGEKMDRRTRIPIEEFIAAMRLASRTPGASSDQDAAMLGIERDEVECLIANMIYKSLMKGYISREHAKVVVSKKGDAFPGTGV